MFDPNLPGAKEQKNYNNWIINGKLLSGESFRGYKKTKLLKKLFQAQVYYPESDKFVESNELVVSETLMILFA